MSLARRALNMYTLIGLGVGLAYLWQETLVLAGMAALLLVASTRSFKVRLQ